MNTKSSGYRWIMMILAALPSLVVDCSQFQFSAFSEEVMSDFSLTLVQFSTVVLSYAVFNGITGFFAGTLEDRFGVKRVVVVGGIITTIVSFIRFMTGNFTVFLIMSLFVGAMSGSGIAAVARISKAWFNAKERGMAVCIMCMGGPAGVVIGQLITPIFSGYRAALLFTTILCAIVTLGWVFLGKDAVPEGPVEKESLRQHLGQVVRSRNIWVLAIGCIAFAAFILGSANLMPRILMAERGLSNEAAVTATSFLNLGTIPGSVIMPIIQRKTGKYKPVLYFICGISAVCSIALLFVPDWMIWVMTAMIGFFGGTLVGFFIGSISGFSGIKESALGCANGFVVMLDYALGGFLLATYVVTPIVDANNKMLFVIDAILCVIMLVIFILLPNVEMEKQPKKS